jgi:hypothetical protein
VLGESYVNPQTNTDKHRFSISTSGETNRAKTRTTQDHAG